VQVDAARETLQRQDRLPMLVVNDASPWMGAALLDGPRTVDGGSRDSDD